MKVKLKFLIPLFIILLVIFAPAKIIASFIPTNSGINISGLSGSIWDGAINNITVNRWSLNEVDYNTSALSLLTGKLGADVIIESGDIQGELTFEAKDDKNLWLDNASIIMELSKFERFISFKGIQLNGKLETNNFSSDIVDRKIDGRLRTSYNQMS